MDMNAETEPKPPKTEWFCASCDTIVPGGAEHACPQTSGPPVSSQPKHDAPRKGWATTVWDDLREGEDGVPVLYFDTEEGADALVDEVERLRLQAEQHDFDQEYGEGSAWRETHDAWRGAEDLLAYAEEDKRKAEAELDALADKHRQLRVLCMGVCSTLDRAVPIVLGARQVLDHLRAALATPASPPRGPRRQAMRTKEHSADVKRLNEAWEKDHAKLTAERDAARQAVEVWQRDAGSAYAREDEERARADAARQESGRLREAMGRAVEYIERHGRRRWLTHSSKFMTHAVGCSTVSDSECENAGKRPGSRVNSWATLLASRGRK